MRAIDTAVLQQFGHLMVQACWLTCFAVLERLDPLSPAEAHDDDINGQAEVSLR